MQNVWHYRVAEYWKQMKSVIQRDSFRNVMDMNSNLGGFAAALKDKDIWVMNVAPVNASARLKIIYDRGLIGTVHDWYAFVFRNLCIAFILAPFSTFLCRFAMRTCTVLLGSPFLSLITYKLQVIWISLSTHLY